MIHAVFGQLDVPVAELIPNKIIHFGKRDPKLEFVHVLRHFFYDMITLGHDPSVRRAEV